MTGILSNIHNTKIGVLGSIYSTNTVVGGNIYNTKIGVLGSIYSTNTVVGGNIYNTKIGVLGSIYSRKSDKTVTNLNLTTKDNVTRDSFKKHIKRFAFIVASSVTNRMTI